MKNYQHARVKEKKLPVPVTLKKQPVQVLPKEKPSLNWVERQFMKIFIKSLLNKIENMKGSWKTSLGGWLALVISISVAALSLIDNDPTTKPNVQEINTALMALGFGLPTWFIGIFGRDKDVSSATQAEAGTNVK